MAFVRSIRLGLLHVAVAITFVVINGVLNRIMIHDLGILSSVVAIMVILPYLLSPLQVWIGQYSDTHPWLGRRRTPYIGVGLVLCAVGTMLTPHAALLMAQDFGDGVLLGVLAFGMWGLGYNLSVVSYLALASDLSSEGQRSRTIAIMWFMMISSIIVTAITAGRALDPYSPEQLIRVFYGAGGIALLLGAIGLIGLEPRWQADQAQPLQSRTSQRAALQAVIQNPQARIFFCYLILMLAAILGQDILLEPFGAQAFGMSVRQTSRLTSIWGGATLAALLLHGLLLHRFLSKKQGATLGAIIAAGGLLVIALSGLVGLQPVFLIGVTALGFGTGIATATNLGLMLDMTTPEQAGLFIGAWSIADTLARGTGTLLGGVLRDIVARVSGDQSLGYITVFVCEALFLAVSLVLLRRINIAEFRRTQPSFTDFVALNADAQAG